MQLRNGVRRVGSTALTTLLSLVFHSPVFAGSLVVSPINLLVISPSKAGAISLTNQDKQPTQLQIRIYRWRQQDGKEVLEPTRAVVANPPSMTIPSDQTYTVRIARLGAAPIGLEESYRLVIDELPPPIDPQPERQNGLKSLGVGLLLRTSLPVFFQAKSATPKISWRIWNADGKLNLEATNAGDRHIKLVGLAVKGPQGVTKFNAAGSNAYVLPGSTLRYEALSDGPTFPVGTAVTITSLKASLLDEVNQPITVAAAP